MIIIKRYFFYLPLIFSFIYSNNLKVKPIIYTLYSSSGSDWIYENSPITTFGTGLGIEFNNQSWSIMVDYLQLGFLGDINHGLYEYSSKKGLPYIDKSKDADGYWSEYVKAKVTYELNTIKVHLGIFDRQWGFGKNAIHISKKAPSYPQFGFDWKINDNLSFIYFHGFLNSGIPDSSQSIHYNNEISQRTFNISRNIASHRIQFTPIKNLELGFNESVIYATRDIDIHYLIPFAPFYPIENYLGDTDNIQMGFDLCLKIKNKQRLYFGFFMDELTPESINVSTWKIPSPLGIIGSHANGEFNGMTASWITQVSMEPALIGVGIDNKSVTYKLMNESDFFTINMFSPEYTKVFVKFSKPAEYSDGFLNKEAITLTDNSVPIFNNATVWFELKTVNKIDFGTHTFFVGEIIKCKTLTPDERVAYMGDTRMKYGGVPRGGH